MVFVHVVSVQSAEGTYPDITLCILGKRLYLLVGNVVGDSRALGSGTIPLSGLRFGRTAGGKYADEKQQPYVYKEGCFF
jgi:hypothetical protein